MKMEQFSRAYVAALAAQAGCNSARPEVDEDSVDIALSMKDIPGCKRSRGKLEMQLKCTHTADRTRIPFHLPCPSKIMTICAQMSLFRACLWLSAFLKREYC